MDGLLMRFLGHSTVRFELAGKTVLTDPVLTGRVGGLTRVAEPLAPGTWAGADLVLISHLHGDHLHVPSLRLIGQDVPIVVPRGAGAWLRRRGFTRVRELDVGESLVEEGLTVTAVRAEHSGHRWGPRFTHGPQAPATGHLVAAGGTTVYVAGDTDLHDGMSELSEVDVALLPVWGWGPNLGPGHLDPERAAEAVRLVRPRVTVPVHWGTLAVPGIARTARMRRLLVEPPLRFADAAADDTEVLVTQPGDAVPLPAPPALPAKPAQPAPLASPAPPAPLATPNSPTGNPQLARTEGSTRAHPRESSLPCGRVAGSARSSRGIGAEVGR